MMIEITLYQTMLWGVFIFTVVSVLFSLEARKKISGYHRVAFDRMLISILFFAFGMLLHLVRETYMDTEILRAPEHMMILISSILALHAGLHVIQNRAEWGLGETW